MGIVLEMRLCECGCEQPIVVKYSWYTPKFIQGHFLRGKKRSEEQNNNHGKNMKEYYKTHTIWNKGIPHSKLTKGKMSKTRLKFLKSKEGIELLKKHGIKMKGKLAGKNNPNWNGGRTKHLKGYIYIHKPAHPYTNHHKYVFEHRLVMEEYLGRYLKPTEVVHHKNGITDDNRIKNLRLFNSDRDHLDFHRGVSK